MILHNNKNNHKSYGNNYKINMFTYINPQTNIYD
jgi:hypothetical protein